MKTVNLASGSKGNSTYVESKEAKILIDDGLSLRQIEGRLKKIGVLPEEIDAIFLTHEHSDHLYGVRFFLKKYTNCKLFVPEIAKELNISSILSLNEEQIEWFNKKVFMYKDIKVCPFVLPHDSNFCVGYSFIFSNIKVSYATDLGFVSDDTLKSLMGSKVLYLESNHDENILSQNPKYPLHTKKRILGKWGHLSNITCANTLVKLYPSGVEQVILSHLSMENNSPELAYNTVKNILQKNGIIEGKNIFVDVAFQNNVGTIFEL